MRTIQFSGFKLASDSRDINEKNISSDSFKVETYRISTDRSASSSVECDDDDVIELIFEDDTEWISNAMEIEGVFSEKERESTRGKSSIFTIPNTLSVPSSNRGIGSIGLKLVRFFIGKKISKKISKKAADLVKFKIGEVVDEKLMPKPNEGLFMVTDTFELMPCDKKMKTNKKYLLFLHGFSSSLERSFIDIFNDQKTILWKHIISTYKDRILTFEHKTICKSPIKNAIELMHSLPKGAKLDIISHSRGGLIADLISKCSIDNGEIFPDTELKLLKDNKAFQDELIELKRLAKLKKVTVEKVIRVACPAKGTTLLKEKRLDYYLNGVLFAMGLIPGFKGNFLYSVFKGFVIDIVKTKSDPDVFPGLAVMVPDSSYQKMVNEKIDGTKDDLWVIEGDAQIGRNIGQTLLVILTNLFYREANDFVVNTDSMRFGVLRENGVNIFLSKDSATTHFRYFHNKNTLLAIFDALEAEGDDLAGFEKVTKEELIAEPRLEKARSISLSVEEQETRQVEDLVDVLFGGSKKDGSKRKEEKIKIRVCNGDLKHSSFPLMVGHFAEDGIVSAEKALDRALNNKLSDRYELGNYPSSTKDNIIIYDENLKPKGCIVIGLGENIAFSEYNLRNAVQFGIVNFAIYMRDHVRKRGNPDFTEKINGISSVCIGSGYANLSMESALTSILFGIDGANEKIQNFNSSIVIGNDEKLEEHENYLTPITEVEFIELYDHIARQAFFSLQEIGKLNFNLDLEIPTKIEGKYGSNKKVEYYKDKSWWHNLVTERVKSGEGSQNTSIRFMSSSGRAKVDDALDYFSTDIVDELIKDYAGLRIYSKELSNSLFQLLIPNKIKDVIRNQSNILWKMNLETAAYPWEMIHDKDHDKDPTFVNAGMIRQLITKTNDSSERITRGNTALIIGDPIYSSKFKELPYAKLEAEDLKTRLEETGDWRISSHINQSRIRNVIAILNEKYKILHIAGHGVYNEDTGESGIVMEDTLLDSVFFSKLPNIPEFVFINCCYTGDIDSQFEKNYKNRYKLAASIGIQLIEMGVQAAVITGWAVNDHAARHFADVFYSKMLKGETFGRAVQNARKSTYVSYSNNNTWGAYQCYGDPWYKLVKRRAASKRDRNYISEDEVIIDLYNAKSRTINKEEGEKERISKKVEEIYNNAEKSKLSTSLIYERIAEVYSDIDEVDKALEFYEKMLDKSNANYSVKALEQYYSLLAKKEITLLEPDPGPHESVEVENLEFFKNISNLLKINETSERLSLKAGIYKRFAVQLTKGFNVLVEKMTENYLKAYELQTKSELDNEPRDYSYPLTNFLTGAYLLPKSAFNDDSILLPAKDKLEEAYSHFKSIQNNKDFWEDINIVNILTVKLLFSKDSNEIVEFRKSIENTYSDRFESGGTLQNLKSEIEHFEFLIKGVKKLKRASLKKEKLNALKRIREELGKLA